MYRTGSLAMQAVQVQKETRSTHRLPRTAPAASRLTSEGLGCATLPIAVGLALATHSYTLCTTVSGKCEAMGRQTMRFMSFLQRGSKWRAEPLGASFEARVKL